MALDGVSFAVEPGQMFGFVGPNGAGKTTTMRIAMGVLAADSRPGALARRAASTRPRGARFGYMPEERGLYPKMRVRAQLAYLASLHGVDAPEAAADRWIERLGLTERAGDRVEQLSLGNQQRVQLAAALVHEPEVLILDEPFSGPRSGRRRRAVAACLNEYAATGVPVVFSSHQLELVERLCEAVAIIKDGRLVASGTVEELRGPGRKVVREVIERPTLAELFREAVK